MMPYVDSRISMLSHRLEVLIPPGWYLFLKRGFGMTYFRGTPRIVQAADEDMSTKAFVADDVERFSYDEEQR